MGLNTFSSLAYFSYVAAGTLQYLKSSRKLTTSSVKILGLGLFAVCAHAYVLYRWIDTPLGQNLSVSHMFSLCCWLISLMVLLASFSKPLQNLCVFILPISAFSILLALFFPGCDIFATRNHPNTLIHILISILAFGILGMAALQATLVYLQSRFLRHKPTQMMVQILPPLQTMESLLFQIIWFGFLLLSASMISAFLWMDEGIVNSRLQKIILSLLAWGLFAALLYGHHQSGLRGSKAIRWILIGVSLLVGAYLAGKTFHLR